MTRFDLAQYPMPLYDANLEAARGVPASALSLHEQLCTHDGMFIVSPEYNPSMLSLLVNMLAWVSRVTVDGPSAAAFGRPVLAIDSPKALSLADLRNTVAAPFYRRALRSAFAALRSAVPNPSVNRS